MNFSSGSVAPPETEIPTETHLVMLCLDYLMDLRRQNDAEELKTKKSLDADFISLAVFALSRSIVRPDYLINKNKCRENVFGDPNCTSFHIIPHISQINHEIMTPSKSYPRPYDPNYNDLHCTNLYRFYRLDGLAAGGPLSGPLRLPDLVDAGLKKTSSRCRLEAEKEIVKSTQFELYIQSVANRGYFKDPANAGKLDDPKEEKKRRARKAHVYKEKYRKAIAKYREKLALNIDHTSTCTEVQNMPQMLSPPTSPPPPRIFSPKSPARSNNVRPFSSPVNRSSNARAFASPPRSCQIPSEAPMSPLTPDTMLTRGTPKTPRTQASIYTSTSASKATPASFKSVKSVKTEEPKRHPKRYASTSAISTKSTCSTGTSGKKSIEFTWGAKTPRRIASYSSANRSTSIGKSADSEAPTDTLDVKSSETSSTVVTKPPEESPTTTLAKMARRRATKSPRESPLDSRRNKTPERKRIETKGRMYLKSGGASRTLDSSSPPPMESPSPEVSRKLDLSPAPTVGSNSENKPPVIEKPKGKGASSKQTDVKKKTPSLYELKVATSESSGNEATAGSFTSGIPSPNTIRHRRSVYEKKLQEQRRASCPSSLSIPDITTSAADLSYEKSRSRNINTSTKQEEVSEEVNAVKLKPLATNRPNKVETSPPAAVTGGRSPVARMRRERNTTQELNKLRYGSATPKLGEPAIASPRQPIMGLKLVGSQDDNSWIKRPPKTATPEKTQEEHNAKARQSFPSSTIKMKAALFQPGGGNGANHRFSFNNNSSSNNDRMPATSPPADIQLDPFRITPPSFLGGSRLYGAPNVGCGGGGTAETPKRDNRLSSPRALASPRGILRNQAPQNFGKPSPLKRAC